MKIRDEKSNSLSEPVLLGYEMINTVLALD